MNFSFWWPVGLVVMAGVGYQVSAKEVAGGADPLAALVVTYLVASLTSFLIYAFTGKKGEKWKEIMSFRPAALALGLSIAFIEIGTIFIYKAGWTMNASFIVTNALITLCLILTGAVLYGEKLSRRQALGIAVSFIGICCIVWCEGESRGVCKYFHMLLWRRLWKMEASCRRIRRFTRRQYLLHESGINKGT